LHDEGIIHCDLKPRNILIKDSKILLCDLDAAIEVNKIRLSKDKFSTAYCPPELARIVLAGDGIKERKDSNHTEESKEPMESRQNLVIVPSFDVWSLGVVLYELCTGRHLFAQDISNDNLVSLDDKIRLCSWYCAPDSMLGAISSLSARNLIRWCLQGKQEDRPSLRQMLNHTLLLEEQNSSDRDKEQPMKYHFFVSHMQIEASGIVGTLSYMLRQLGCHCWRGKIKLY
jgi:serine/threonine protein kinase